MTKCMMVYTSFACKNLFFLMYFYFVNKFLFIVFNLLNYKMKNERF